MDTQKGYFWFPGLSDVTIAKSLSGSTRDFLKLSFYMFPYNKILKVSKVKSDLIFEVSTVKIPLKYQISANSVKGLWR